MISESINLHDAVFEVARTRPNNAALIEGARVMNYRELTSTALRWAGALNSHVGHESANIGILSKRNSFACVAILATLSAGMTYVPLNVTYPVNLLAEIAQAAGLDAIIVGEESLDLASELVSRVPVPIVFLSGQPLADTSTIESAILDLNRLPSAETNPKVVRSEASAYLLFTSGSTGPSKGVAIPHRAIVAFSAHMQKIYSVEPADRLTQLFEHSFDLSLFDLFMAWRHGATVVLLDRDAPDLVDQISELGISIWFSVPSVAVRLMRSGKLAAGILPSLRLSLFCGEALYGDVAAAWQRAAPNSQIENLYGPTELTVACSRFRLPAQSFPDDVIVPIGEVFPGLTWKVLDDGGKPVNTGETGELCVGGVQMFNGYWGDAALNVGRFYTIDGGQQLYRTGDMVRLEDDVLRFVRRRDDQIKLNGFRIELGQVVSALKRAGANDAVALAWPDRDRPIAIRALVTGAAATDEIMAAVKAILPEHMMPADITSVSEIPLTRNGKTDVSAASLLLGPSKVAPSLEHLISDTLGIPIASVRDDLTIYAVNGWDSFGHINLIIALEEMFGLKIDRQAINRTRSVADLRALISQGGTTPPVSTSNEVRNGLAGVLMDRTKISRIDGEEGRLTYRGYQIEDLCDTASFDDVIHLLVYGEIPSAQQLAALRVSLGNMQALPKRSLEFISGSTELHPAKALAIAAACADIDDPIDMIGYLAAAFGAWSAARSGIAYEPKRDVLHHERVACYLLGRPPSPSELDFIRQDLILHAEHGANASTLAMRTAISAEARLSEAIVAAIMTFGGPVHGGAVEGVAALLDKTTSAQKIKEHVASVKKIMGFGHRIYRTDDPRAIRLRTLVERMSAETGNTRDLEIADGLVEEMRARRNKGIAVNIDLFTAVGYRLLGVEARIATVLAILGRSAGWCAHALEQKQNNILIRPDLLYVGPAERPLVRTES
ncbi:citrate/2-methylcitrate synthase [Xanthobacter sp.]|uniref:citrate/2-methylcitrate synthase n=1 Tax=Xanthobacter sp. TaxID=35809 RepID=UPI0025E55E4C|nr:citrate/2-methylcitrate synthase [Xanthobacter sp.]